MTTVLRTVSTQAKETAAHARMVDRFGAGPAGRRCADCQFLILSGRWRAHGIRERICRIHEREMKADRPVTAASVDQRTAWKAPLPACGRFQSTEG